MKPLLFYMIIALCLVNTGWGFAQEPSRIDSLLLELEKVRKVYPEPFQGDSAKVNLLSALARELQDNKPAAWVYAQQSLQLAEKLDYQRGIANACGAISSIKSGIGDYQTALKYYRKELRIRETLGDRKSVAAIFKNIGIIYTEQGEHSRGLEYCFKALKIGEEAGDKKTMAATHNSIGSGYTKQGRYDKALEHYFKALKIYNGLGEKNRISAVMGNIGNTYCRRNNNPKGLEYYLKALKIDEELGNIKGLSYRLGSIGIIYYRRKEYPKALEYYFKSLRMNEELNNKRGIAVCLGNIGAAYKEQGDRLPDDAVRQANYSRALEYFFKASKMDEELGNREGTARHLGNIGMTYKSKGNLSTDDSARYTNNTRALAYYFKALEIDEKLRNKRGIAYHLGNIGSLYVQQFPGGGNYTEAIAVKMEVPLNFGKIGLLHTWQSPQGGNYMDAEGYLLKALELAREIEALDIVSDAEVALSEFYEKTGQAAYAAGNMKAAADKYKEAYEHHLEYSAAEDSLFNKGKSRQIAEMQAQYETENKEKEIALLSKDKQLQAEKLKKQNTYIWASSGGGFLLILLISFIYMSYLRKRKANILLREKNEMIEKQKKHIVDSINYAKRIQDSILKHEDEARKILPFDSFVLFQPKDIVSGDFYFFSKQGNKYIIAAIDCTGHGVPGAFMSMIGNSFLNMLVNEEKNTDPAEILKQLHARIYEGLHQEEETQAQDGMDMAVCTFDMDSKTIRYAGAMNPVYFIENGSLEMIKGDIKSVGGRSHKPGREYQREFTNHEIPMKENMTIYLFSDGYMDQFGMREGRRQKFGSQRFKQFLFDIHGRSMAEQKELLENKIIKWQAGQKQIDDMLVIGIKLCPSPVTKASGNGTQAAIRNGQRVLNNQKHNRQRVLET